MGDEYIAEVDKECLPSLEKVARELQLTKRYFVESASETAVAFRLSNKERRPDWPEDFVLSCRSNALVLTIYAGSETEIVRDVESALSRCGSPASFEEA